VVEFRAISPQQIPLYVALLASLRRLNPIVTQFAGPLHWLRVTCRCMLCGKRRRNHKQFIQDLPSFVDSSLHLCCRSGWRSGLGLTSTKRYAAFRCARPAGFAIPAKPTRHIRPPSYVAHDSRAGPFAKQRLPIMTFIGRKTEDKSSPPLSPSTTPHLGRSHIR